MDAFTSPFAPGTQLWCEGLSKFIKEQIDFDSVLEYQEDEERWHLGASIIAKPCARQIWYSFRWCYRVLFDGRMHRLFQRGHREEYLFVHRLKRIGIHVWDRDPSSTPDENGELKQWRIEHPRNKHYGGSLDGISYITWIPPEYAYMISEFKTHGENSFAKIKKDGVRKAKPEHYGQMSTYGQKKGYRFGLYCAVNKNTDELYIEVVPLKWELADILDSKAIDVIERREPPRRISENSASQVCKFCDFRGICHLGQPLARNCRSCKHSQAVPSGEWYCDMYQCTLSKELIRTGCATWVPVA